MATIVNLPMSLMGLTQPRQVIAGWCDFVSGQMRPNAYSAAQQTALELGKFFGSHGDIVLAQLFSSEPIEPTALKLGYGLIGEWAQKSPDEILIQGAAELIQGQLSKLVSTENVQDDLIPSEDEIRMMLENLRAFVNVGGAGRKIYMVHKIEFCEKIREARAGIGAVREALSSCENLKEMRCMIAFLKEVRSLDVAGFNCFVSSYRVPEELISELHELRSLFIERTLKVMKDPDLKSRQASLIPPQLESPYALWAPGNEMPIFASIFSLLSSNSRAWYELKKSKPQIHAIDRMIMVLQSELDSLKEKYS